MDLKKYLKLPAASVLVRKLLSAELSFPNVEKYREWVISGIIGLIFAATLNFTATYFLLKIFNQIKLPQESTQTQEIPIKLPPLLSDFPTIMLRNIFNSEGQIGASASGANTCTLQKSSLPLKFTGIIYGGSAAASLIVLESTSAKESDTFLLGDSVPGDAIIANIESDKVIFTRNNCPEFLELEASPLPKKRMAGAKVVKSTAKKQVVNGEEFYKEDGFERAGTSVQVARKWLDRAITTDLTKTLQDAKANANMVGNEIRGWMLTKIRPDSVYEKLGLTDGDIVETVNGVDLSDAIRAVQTLKAMQNENTLELSVKRGNQVLNYKVQVK